MRKRIAGTLFVAGMCTALALAQDTLTPTVPKSTTTVTAAPSSPPPLKADKKVISPAAAGVNDAPAKCGLNGESAKDSSSTDVDKEASDVHARKSGDQPSAVAAENHPYRRSEAAPVAPAKTDQSELLFKGECFVAPLDWQADGIIVSAKDKNLLISAGDSVFINIGSSRIRPGMKCMVYRRKRKFKDPETHELLGFEMARVGKLEITTDVGEKTATAKVILSYDPIEIGDAVKIIYAGNNK